MVSFKELEWVKHPSADMWRCDTIIGRYQVSSIVSPASWTFDGLPGADAKGFADDEAEAKAAAQADYEARIRSALSAQVQDVAVPEGWQLVPTEPTEEMREAYKQAHGNKCVDIASNYPTEHPDDGGGPFGYGYRAMLAAGPAAKLEEKP